MTVVHRLLPPNLLELRRVLVEQHKDILIKLTPDVGIDITLAEVATELGIAIDGMYDVDDLCEMLLWELENKTRSEKGLPTKMRYRGLKMIQTEIDVEITPKKEEPELDKSLPLIGVNTDKSVT